MKGLDLFLFGTAYILCPFSFCSCLFNLSVNLDHGPTREDWQADADIPPKLRSVVEVCRYLSCYLLEVNAMVFCKNSTFLL